MTVKELMKQLAGQDPEAEVLLRVDESSEGDFSVFGEVEPAMMDPNDDDTRFAIFKEDIEEGDLDVLWFPVYVVIHADQ